MLTGRLDVRRFATDILSSKNTMFIPRNLRCMVFCFLSRPEDFLDAFSSKLTKIIQIMPVLLRNHSFYFNGQSVNYSRISVSRSHKWSAE